MSKVKVKCLNGKTYEVEQEEAELYWSGVDQMLEGTTNE